MAQEVDLGAGETMEALDPSEFLVIKIKSQSVLSVEKAKSHPELSGAGGGGTTSRAKLEGETRNQRQTRDSLRHKHSLRFDWFWFYLAHGALRRQFSRA